MGELRVYEFDPRIGVYGFSREEALRTVENLLGELRAAEPTVAFAQQHHTMDKAWLKRKGIDREGLPAAFAPHARPPGYKPPPDWMSAQERDRRTRERRRRE